MRLLTAGSLVRVQLGEPKVSVDDGEGTPVPIPNTEVKLTRAENTWRATARENRSTLTFKKILVTFTSDEDFFMSSISHAASKTESETNCS